MLSRLAATSFLVAILAACSSTPTSPSHTAAAEALTVAALPIEDARFDAAFYESFTKNAKHRTKSLVVFVPAIDSLKQPVPPETIRRTKHAAATLLEALGLPPDVRDAEGASSRALMEGISVSFDAKGVDGVGGFTVTSLFPGLASINYKAVTYDVCGGLAMTVVRHELMHALGFSHTDDSTEVMYPELRYCDLLPSARERFHAGVSLGLPR